MNNFIKDLLARTIFRVFSLVNQIVVKDDSHILLYSNVGFRDNVRAIYDHLIENGYNQKYKIIISADSLVPDILPANVKAISCVKGIVKYFTSGHVFYCQGKIPIYPSLRQNVVQMWHGTPFKGNDSRGDRNKTTKSFYTHILSPSPYFIQIFVDNFSVSKEQVAICGQPRTDVMFEENEKPDELTSFRKIIMWMPTYRKSSVLGDEDVKQTSIIPIFSIAELNELDSKLSNLNICLLIKLHPLQNLDLYEEVKLKNIQLLNQNDFQNKGWDLYRLLSCTDALISDYSSVFYDYMLLDKPIGFAIDDFDEYRDNRGFAVDDPEFFMAGEKIKSKEELYQFIDHVSKGIDPYKEQRNEVNRITHTYPDGNNSKRALEIGGVSLT